MSKTKGEFVSSALEEIGLAEYEFDISPDQVQSGVSKLDAMIAAWGKKGIRLSYPLSESSASGDSSYIPNWAEEAVITNLAIKIAPSYGKTVSAETKIAAKDGLNMLYATFSAPHEMQYNIMPKGAGYKSTGAHFTPAPVNPYLEPVDVDIDLSGEPEDE